MENKQIVTSGKITQSLIVNWLLWGILFGIIYSFVYGLLSYAISSLVLRAILAIILQGIMAIGLWKLSTSSSFREKTISYNDVSKVIKNLVIFTIIICVLNGAYNFFEINSKIDKAVNSNIQLRMSESMMSRIYSDKKMAEYNKQKEEAINKVKSQAYVYLTVLEIGLTAVYLAVLPLEKKEILKYVS